MTSVRWLYEHTRDIQNSTRPIWKKTLDLEQCNLYINLKCVESLRFESLRVKILARTQKGLG